MYYKVVQAHIRPITDQSQKRSHTYNEHADSCYYTVYNISINCISNRDGVKYLRGCTKVL